YGTYRSAYGCVPVGVLMKVPVEVPVGVPVEEPVEVPTGVPVEVAIGVPIEAGRMGSALGCLSSREDVREGSMEIPHEHNSHSGSALASTQTKTKGQRALGADKEHRQRAYSACTLCRGAFSVLYEGGVPNPAFPEEGKKLSSE